MTLRNDRIRQQLAALGYRLLERESTWWECLLIHREERWLGVGTTREEAFEDALSRLLPSAAARAGLEALLAREEVEAPLHETPPAGAEAPEPEGRETPAAERQPPLPEPIAAAEAPGPAQPGAGQELAEVGSDPCGAAGGDRRGTPPSAPSAEVEVEPDRVRFVVLQKGEEQERAVGALEELAARIDRERPRLAVLAPARQRLVILGWLAEVRSAQERFPRSIEIAGLAPDIVRTLRSLTESWWPGMISAFQRDARPWEVARRDLREMQAEPPETWAEVAEMAEEAHARLREQQSALGYDEDGWADRSRTYPPPEDPEGLLESIVAEVEACGAPLGDRQPREGAPPAAGNLIRWAQYLRWLRGSGVEAVRWGALAGRLRFWAQISPDGKAASRILDPAHRPARSWRSVVQRLEEEEEEIRILAEVLAAVPDPSAGTAALVAWLDRALPLTGNHQQAIVEACRPHRETILALPEERWAEKERRIRRRFQKLRQALASPCAERPPAPGAIPMTNGAAERADGIAEEAEAVPEEVLVRTRGKRALFVSNRTDNTLQDRLDTLLCLDSLEWAEATPRRIDAAVEAIAAGTYDLVVGATGFLNHTDDGRLARACRGAGVPYIRADRGRAGAVLRAIARDLS